MHQKNKSEQKKRQQYESLEQDKTWTEERSFSTILFIILTTKRSLNESSTELFTHVSAASGLLCFQSAAFAAYVNTSRQLDVRNCY